MTKPPSWENELENNVLLLISPPQWQENQQPKSKLRINNMLFNDGEREAKHFPKKTK